MSPTPVFGNTAMCPQFANPFADLTPNPDFIAIDFETASRSMGSACAVGICVVKDGVIAQTRSSLINPVGPFIPEFIDIHKITPDDVVDAPTFGDLWQYLGPVLDGNTLVAHNAKFDMAVLEQCVRRYSCSEINARVLCTLEISRQFWPEMPSHGLSALARAHNIDLDHHDAASDAQASASLLIKAVEQFSGGSLEKLVSASYEEPRFLIT